MLARPSLEVPPYVSAVRALLHRRGARTRLIAAWAIVHVSVRRGRTRFEYTIVPADDEPATLARTGTILSLRVYAQDARAFPVDAALTLFNAPRMYVLRRRVAVSTLDAELIDDGRLYSDGAAIVACSLDAAGYGGVPHTPVPGLPAAAHVASGERHAPLTATVASRAPLVTSDGFLFPDATELVRADVHIRTLLVPHAARTLRCARPRMRMHVLAPLTTAHATLWCRLYLAID